MMETTLLVRLEQQIKVTQVAPVREQLTADNQVEAVEVLLLLAELLTLESAELVELEFLHP
jgi:hypothetical protein